LPQIVHHQGYKPAAAKSTDEYAKLDAEDESLARWKASLGIVSGTPAASAGGPKVCRFHFHQLPIDDMYDQITVLSLELDSETLPVGKKISLDLADIKQLEATKKEPIVIKEAVQYK